MGEKKILHIVGNRPQFIKLAPVSHKIKQMGYRDIILHTGQHYDDNMSKIFFEEMGIEEPAVNLNIGSGSHAEMTAKAMIGIEKYIQEERIDVVILYGDTDSTLAGALAASKLNVPIVHVEAGPRTYNEYNPEEKNRVVVDHLSTLLCCPDIISKNNLEKEGLGKKAVFTGDVMYDSYVYVSESKREQGKKFSFISGEYVLMTWHRQENTEDAQRMKKILDMIEQCGKVVVCPLHPRTRKKLEETNLLEKARNIPNFVIIDPVGYFEMVELMQNCCCIITDSGGLSKESSFAGAPCLFMVELDVWIQLQEIGWIEHIDFGASDYISKVQDKIKSAKKVAKEERPHFYGDGNAAEKIVLEMKQRALI